MRLFNALGTQPWAITTEGFQIVLDVYAEATRRKLAGESFDWQTLAQKKGIQIRNTKQCELRDNGIAIINVVGPIFRRADWFTEMSGVTSTESLATDFAKLIEDRDIRGIILNGDSPGGEAVGIAELARYIFKSRGIKPMVAYNDGMTASGMYWLAAAMGNIYSDRIASSGSIGVVAQIQDFSEQEAMMGIRTYKFRSTQSPRKNLDVATDEGQKAIQEVIDDIADVFVGDIALMRSTEDNQLTKDQVIENYGQGGIMVAKRAKRAGMIDGILSLEELVLKVEKDADRNFKSSSVSVLEDSPEKKLSEEQKKMALKTDTKIKSEQDTPENDEVTNPEKTEEVETPPAKPAEAPAAADAPEKEEAPATPAKEEEAPAAPAAPAAAQTAHAGANASPMVHISAEAYEQLKAQAAESVAAKATLLATQAGERAGILMRAGQVDPAQLNNVKATLEFLMSEDAANPAKIATAFDTNGKVTAEGSRVDAFIASLPPAGTLAASTLTTEEIPTYPLSSAKADEDVNKTEEAIKAEAAAEVQEYHKNQNKK